MPVGGDIIEVTYNHPNPSIGSGIFYPKANEDSTFDLGGFRGGDDASMVDGGGRNMRQINRVRWSFEVLCSWDMNTENELQKLVDMAKDSQEADWTITHINGTVHQGKGAPVGDLSGAGNASTFQLKASGGGVMKKII